VVRFTSCISKYAHAACWKTLSGDASKDAFCRDVKYFLKKDSETIDLTASALSKQKRGCGRPEVRSLRGCSRLSGYGFGNLNTAKEAPLHASVYSYSGHPGKVGRTGQHGANG